MTSTPTIAVPEASSGLVNAARRGAPEAAPPAQQRFAELLQRRRDAQPAPTQRQAEARPSAKAESAAGPTPRSNVDGGGADAGGSAPQAASGCEAPQTQREGKPQEPDELRPRDLPAIDSALPPAAATADPGAAVGAASSAGTSDHDAVHRDDREPTLSDAGRPELAGWPGMPGAPNSAAAAGAACDQAALAATGVGNKSIAIDPRAGSGKPDAGLAATTGAARTTASDAGNSGGGGAGAGDAGTSSGGEAAWIAANALQSQAAAGAERSGIALHAETALAGATGVHAAQRFEGGAVVQLALPTPVDAPDFARALGAQVSLFARNGLAQAELQLTPAEMGPIHVRIAIDGAHARVDFAADSAATRQVIERGLADLASALREQGLTLAGGGVFQRTPDRSGEQGASDTERTAARSRRRGIAPVAAAEPQRIGRATARPGGVDLYA